MIDARLARQLVRDQFPQWRELEVREVSAGGWDNRSFRLGNELLARFPSADAYAAQVDKEQRWLLRLAGRVPLEIPTPVARGRPGRGYPHAWSVYRWIEGKPLDSQGVAIATDLAAFIAALHRIDATDGPRPGPHNFHRGDDLRIYDGEVDRALSMLGTRVDQDAARRLWANAAMTKWKRAPVWVHGDIGPGNLLERSGRLVAVIDFGNLAVGDPACDLAIAWTWFDEGSRDAFRSSLPLDDATWTRARAWALWKALVVGSGVSRTNAIDYREPMAVIARCVTPG